MPEISLQGAGVVSLVCKRIAAGVPEHVWMSLEPWTRLSARPLNHAGEACGAERRSTLLREHEGRLGLLLALEGSQGV